MANHRVGQLEVSHQPICPCHLRSSPLDMLRGEQGVGAEMDGQKVQISGSRRGIEAEFRNSMWHVI
ncbi:MAG: hypothetical protein NFW16_16710 [Candidatus Accumulibacter sp.]|uniref:hypothetical protein n=1 Tax=Accumulibacter sp. TaxID=2053492 RepID=UPI0025825F11|nr:hypothetical protein [Accumulibacter sp.]MCM8623325.1 hypothetical protein [Accumulibacter sp.]